MIAVTSPSRRGVLGALAAAPALLAAPAMGSPASFFQIALAEYRRRKADEETFCQQQYDPAYEELRTRAAALPHVTVTFDGDYTLTTANQGDIRLARSHTANMRRGRGVRLDHLDRACRRITAGALVRDRHIARIRRQLGVDALDERSEALNVATQDALWAAVKCPVESARDLELKLDLIEADEAWQCEDARKAVMADVRTLAGVA